MCVYLHQEGVRLTTGGGQAIRGSAGRGVKAGEGSVEEEKSHRRLLVHAIYKMQCYEVLRKQRL